MQNVVNEYEFRLKNSYGLSSTSGNICFSFKSVKYVLLRVAFPEATSALWIRKRECMQVSYARAIWKVGIKAGWESERHRCVVQVVPEQSKVSLRHNSENAFVHHTATVILNDRRVLVAFPDVHQTKASTGFFGDCL